MQKRIPSQRIIVAKNPSPIQSSSESFDPNHRQSLPMDELESVIRLAQANTRSQTAPQDDSVGPGDVQHLRGDASSQFDSSIGTPLPDGWPNPQNADLSLQQTEQRLRDAILGSDRVDIASPVARSPLNRVQPSSSMSEDSGLTLDDLGDVELDIAIELGRAEILIEDVLKLREGSVVTLDKLAGDPVDIVANGRLVARGELLVIDGKFGVRLSEVL